ncbi:magnesium and cobalt transport protein CorA [Naumannella cuiyingiana]|uniref:Magnesium transporter n=1 Tax=Naumannella cuiyingiana TaxID=1347891 RepID=A0A7Z0D6G3_9ACTN|nr:magnesium and cobalt transport protein CorA [Naumannella cuiyingiana]NYI69777.1 magnesium transporter [Naumannella cuiyingiana]
MAPIVQNAVYRDGGHKIELADPEQTYRALREGGGLAWIGLYRPNEAEIASLAERFSLHELAVEDTVTAHQRPKLERYDDVLFTVLRPARYIDAEERVEFGELHVFTGPDFVITVRHAESPKLQCVRRRMEQHPELLQLGPEAVLYAVLDQVVDEYVPVVDGLEHDIEEIEYQVFAGDSSVSRRIYELSREVVEFQRATRPMIAMLRSLTIGFDKYGVDEELRRSLRDVEDHLLRVVERLDQARGLLQNILTVNSTLVAERQNEEMQRATEVNLRQNEEVKRISGWGAILFAPTLVGTIYGMNFEIMPELGWTYGYPFALGLMALVCISLFIVFRHRRWI